MAILHLDRDSITLTPERSRSHMQDLLQIGVAHGFDRIEGEEHRVPASVWRFDREMEGNLEGIVTGQSLTKSGTPLRVGLTSVKASCRLPGFVFAESCYPPPPGKPAEDFRLRFLSMRVQADAATLWLALKPHYAPETMLIHPEVNAEVSSVTLPAEEWTLFTIHRYDQAVVSIGPVGQGYDVDLLSMHTSSRYEKVGRGIV